MDRNNPLNQGSNSNTPEEQVMELIQLIRSGEEDKIHQALLLAKELGKPAAFHQYLEGLLPLYQLAFNSKRKKLDARELTKLFQLTQLNIIGRKLTTLPESLGQLHNLQTLICDNNQLHALPESLDQLHNLEELHCDNNQLQALPESLATLPKLKKLDARNNPLIHIPPALRQKQGLELLLDQL